MTSEIKSFKTKQRLIAIALLLIAIISTFSTQIVDLANSYLSPTSASIIVSFVFLIVSVANQLAVEKRVPIAEERAIDLYLAKLGFPKEEVLDDTSEGE